MITVIGFGFLGFIIGLAVGSNDQAKTIQKAFEKEGYDYAKFYEVIYRNDR